MKTKMKTIFLSILAVAAVFSNCLVGVCYADENQLTDYSSREEYLTAFGYTDILADVGNYTELSFEISLDQDHDQIVLDTVYLSDEKNDRGHKSAKVTHDVFSNLNQLLYTITARGTFDYGTGYCNVTNKSGSFERASGSLWTSTPSVSNGHVSSTKAYVNVSGTAKCLGFANRTYSLYLYCTSSGTLSSSFIGT